MGGGGGSGWMEHYYCLTKTWPRTEQKCQQQITAKLYNMKKNSLLKINNKLFIMKIHFALLTFHEIIIWCEDL